MPCILIKLRYKLYMVLLSVGKPVEVEAGVYNICTSMFFSFGLKKLLGFQNDSAAFENMYPVQHTAN